MSRKGSPEKNFEIPECAFSPGEIRMIAYALHRFPPAHDRLHREADALANATAITRAPLSEFGEGCTVRHIEADAHEAVHANCAPTESFVDNARRRAFDNFAECEPLNGNPQDMRKLP